jgi:hypothetical protein
MALAQVALAVLAVHLVSKGGVAAPPPPAGVRVVVPAPTPAPTVEPTALPPRARGPEPPRRSSATACRRRCRGAGRPAGKGAARGTEPPPPPNDARVYDPDDVDVQPRRLTVRARPTRSGPEVAKGEKVSITASCGQRGGAT